MPRKNRHPKHNESAPVDAGSREAEAIGLERLVFFSDAVFAIAITLLALEIRLPTETGSLTNEELLRELLSIWPKYLSYVISFLVIGSFWVAHHRKFRFIERFDGRLLYLNLLMLMFVAFIPFPTAVVSENASRTATIFYALAIIAVGLTSALVWWYAVRAKLAVSGLEASVYRRGIMRSLVVPAVFLLSIGLAFFNSDWARFSWVLTLPATLAVR
jgi:TMEM175 potassium channel family protein